MIVNSLELSSFRNHTDTKLSFSEKFNVFYGNNGQGKTNILEALYICASGRSHRTSKDVELIQFGKDAFKILTKVNNSGYEKEIDIKFFNNQKKQIRVNQIPIKKIGSLMGNLFAVIFSPEDLFIVKQGPAERRRFVDITLSQIKPSYFYDLQSYSKILKQRNMLLKNFDSQNNLKDTIDIWNYKLSQVAASIIVNRKQYSDKISELASNQHRFLTVDKEIISFNYDCSFDVNNKYEKNIISELYLKQLQKSIHRDVALGYTSIGPHRDDYDIFINDKSLKLYGSQGQQRSAVLSLKIAEIELISKETGEMPILLLDDVMSELDDNRQKYLLNSIVDVQTFITCTSKLQFDKLSGNSLYFLVSGGQIIGN